MGNFIFVLCRPPEYYSRELGSKAQGGSQLDSILRLSEVDRMSVHRELAAKNDLSFHIGSAALWLVNPVHENGS